MKILLLDIDGVLIRPPHYFAQELELRGYENAVASLTPFFTGACEKCFKGEEDIVTAIAPYLKDFAWSESVSSYLKQHYEFEAQYLDQKLLQQLRKLRKQGVYCYMCTDQEKSRSKFLLENMQLAVEFDGHFISCNLGYRKHEEEFWKKMFAILEREFSDLRYEDIVFYDDRQKNIDIAKSLGIDARLFVDQDVF